MAQQDNNRISRYQNIGFIVLVVLLAISALATLLLS